MQITDAGTTLVFNNATPEEKKRIFEAAKEPKPKKTRLATRKEVASLCGVHTETIKRWGRIGKIHPIKLSARCVRYNLAEVEALLQNGATQQ